MAAPLVRGGVHLPVQLDLAGLAGLAFAFVSLGGERAPLVGLVLMVPFLGGTAQMLPILAGSAISFDPPASGSALASSAAALLALGAACALADTGRGKERVVHGLGLCGVAVASATLRAALLGYQPLFNPTSPFVNPNHQLNQ